MEQQTPLTGTWCSESDQLWKAYSSVTTPHVATLGDPGELRYTRAVVDVLLQVLVPAPHLETRTGRFVVGELITCNVILPLIDKLSDPDWLNLLLIEIFSKSSKPKGPIGPEPLTSSPSLPPPPESHLAPQQEAMQEPEAPPAREETELVQTEMPELAAYDVVDSDVVDCSQNNAEEEELLPYNPFYQENDSDLDSPLADSLVLLDPGDGLYDRQKDCGPAAENNNDVDLESISCPVDGFGPKVMMNSEPADYPDGPYREAEGPPSISSFQDPESQDGSSSVNSTRDLVLHVQQTGLGTSELAVVSPLQGSSPMPSFSFEPLSSPDGPVMIQNLRIAGTITAKEHRGTGSHPYTLYTIKVRRHLVP